MLTYFHEIKETSFESALFCEEKQGQAVMLKEHFWHERVISTDEYHLLSVNSELKLGRLSNHS